jgi:lipopolysaccharide export system permease protein
VQVAKYFLFTMPGMAGQALPFAALIATLLSLGNLSRHHEITAMRASGVSLVRIVLPVLVGGGLISVLGFANSEWIVPEYAAQAAYIRNVEVEKKQHRVVFQQRKLWLRGPDNSIINIDLVTPDRREMIGVSIFKLNPDYSLRERISAGRLTWEQDGWKLRDSKKYLFNGGAVVSRSADGETYNVVEKPADMGMIVKRSEEMNFRELLDYVRRLKTSGYKAVRHEVDLYGKIAYPFASLLMVMIAVPFSLQWTRSGGMARGIALAVLIAAVYWAFLSGGRALGISGAIPPVHAAWFANIAFAAAALFALFRMQRAM